jgi:cell cycle sensor histidine kinase DivJ
MGYVGLLKLLRDYLDGLVHPSAQRDPLTAARHRAFIAPRLLGSLIALAAFPLYVTLRGIPSVLELGVLAWLLIPMAVAYFLSRTGRYEGAHILSSFALTAMVSVVAAYTGGSTSFAAIWLVIVPLEAALSASRRVVALAATFALVAIGGLMLLRFENLLPEPAIADSGALAALGVTSATLYGAGLALGVESLARTSVWLLYAEEDRYRFLATNMTDVITRHGKHGAVLFASPAAESMFGARVHELAGHGLFDRVHIADRPAYLTALANAAAGETATVEFRARREGDREDGNGAKARPVHVWIEMRCRPLDHPDMTRPAAREVVAVMRDVTERKAQERAIEAARAELERASASKSRFLATMSHELRTPLNAIIGFSEMLGKEGTIPIDAARRRDYAKLINESGHHLLSVVNGILDMSKMETGEFAITPESFAPAPVVGQCCDMLALRAAENGIELSVRVAPDLPDIVADKRAFKQVLLNLLANAVKFTDRGGHVALRARAEEGHIVLVVEDDGIGIGESDLAHVGNPFFQARSAYDRRHDGTGLGLSIVKGLVALHGGDLQIASVLGKGTRVTVRLPVDCERASVASEAPVSPENDDVFPVTQKAVKKIA